MAQKLALGQRYYNYGFTDSVLFSEAYMRPRYKGSKLIAKEINKYTDYSQLTAEEYSSHLYNNTNISGGIWPGYDNWESNDFIKTTKPIDGSFPPLFEFYKQLPIIQSYVNDNRFMGNRITSTIPGKALSLSNGLGWDFFTTSPLKYKTAFKQNGGLIGDTIFEQFGNGMMIWECQYMGGYRRDRSYGKTPVIEVKTNTIYEFDWGGSAYPEIEKGGSVHLKQIINVDSYKKNTPQVYIVNEDTNDSFREAESVDETGMGVSITVDNPNEETDFQINLKRSLYRGDRITLNEYGLNESPHEVGPLGFVPPNAQNPPVRNVITLDPGVGVPSYGGMYTATVDIPVYVTSSDDSDLLDEIISAATFGLYNPSATNSPPVESVTVPLLPETSDGLFPFDDRMMPDPGNPGGPNVLASSLRNISGSYLIPKSNTDGALLYLQGGQPFLNFNYGATKYIPRLKINSKGVYVTGSNIQLTSASLVPEIATSMAEGNRYFVSFYKDLDNVAEGGLNQIGEPIEIQSVSFSPIYSIWMILKPDPRTSQAIFEYTGTNSAWVGKNNPDSIGALIWKSQQGTFATMKPTNTFADFSYSRLKEGGFYREFSTDAVKNNFINIVETVGIKPLK
jgi:hypothetical protein